MPIANCFIRDEHISQETLHEAFQEWVATIGVHEKDICINITTNHIQIGQQYDAFVNLFLPSLWQEDNIKMVQMALLDILERHLQTTADKVFIMTHIVQSGHVVENGETITW